ncbi:hypothetical protein HK099_002993 [Clydaea vesicula]|uniref:WD repeat-containing protein 92 n=1 Tax=Clydaea vesicula TaxID=447962 RepID=A0AAD5U213_9FUNG|nr:hypothetical protein HK099_002993 [Clydaea vesicula]
MNGIDKPQIITHITKSLSYTPYCVKWIPCSAKFVVLGALQVYELTEGDAKLIIDVEKPSSFKCGTFSHSAISNRTLATGDFDGRLQVYDIENPDISVYSVKAHEKIVNCIDGAGSNFGAPELVTGSSDGIVKIWDLRQRDKPVAKIVPESGEVRDTWSVAFGNSYNDEERVVAAGYENGDIKMFDLKNMKLIFETNAKNGVVALEFDRKDIKMNKLVATCLESNFNVYDLRTYHPKKKFPAVNQKAKDNTTIWTVRHLPQNRDIFITSGGGPGGGNYPPQRTVKSEDDNLEGVPGTLQAIQTVNAAEQPVSSFDWSPDKQGLCVFSAFDQQVRVGIVTKLSGL